MTVLVHPGDNWMMHVVAEQIRPGDIVVAAVTAAGLVFAFTMCGFVVGDLRVLAQIGTTIGVGLIGGSFALALRKAGLVNHIVGVGRRPEPLAKARELGLIDEIRSYLDGLSDRDLAETLIGGLSTEEFPEKIGGEALKAELASAKA